MRIPSQSPGDAMLSHVGQEHDRDLRNGRDLSGEECQERLFLRIQKNSFGYFLHETNPANGLVLDKTADNWPASIAAVRMALTAYPIGVERNLMSRDAAVERTLTTLRFFAHSEQSAASTATGYKGLLSFPGYENRAARV